jgi:hypothetical protein
MKQIILAIILIAFPVALFSGYEAYSSQGMQASPAGLGDLSPFKTIVSDVQGLADRGDMPGAAKRITDFESAWDQAETAIRPLNQEQWGNIDGAADTALRTVRAASPAPDKVKLALAALMAALNDPSKPV